jgi:PAS domain S-box-containing protein
MVLQSNNLSSNIGEITNIQFNDLFELEDIQRLQDLFSDASGVASIITHPDGTPITKPSNFCRLCETIIRKTEKGIINCFKSDALLGTYNPLNPNIQTCLSGGLWDAGASITVGGKHIANWLIGQVRNESMDESQMIQYATEIGADKEEYMNALKEVPFMNIVQFTKVSKMLFAFANELSDKAYNILQLKIQIAEREKVTTENKMVEMALLTSEKRFQHAFDFSAVGTCFVNATGRFLKVNRILEGMLLYSQKELTGLTFNDITHPNDISIGSAYLKSLLNKEIETASFEKRYIRKDGSILYALTSTSILVNEENTTLFITQIIDITERELAEQALKESEEKFSKIFDRAPVLISITNFNDGTYLDVNSFALNFSGFSREEVIGKKSHEIGWITEENKKLLMSLLEKNGHIDHLELPFKTKSGKVVFGIVNGEKIIINNKECLLTITTDITERNHVQDALRISEEKFRKAFFTNPDSISINRLEDGMFVSVNKGFIQIMGYTENEVIGKTSFELNVWKDPEDRRRLIHGLKDDGIVENLEIIFNAKGGTMVDGLMSAALIDLEGVSHIISITRDITSRKLVEAELVKAKEKAEESDRLKSAFLQNLSHEIRTPMNAIMGFSNLLAKNFDNKPKLDKFSEIINQRCKDLLEIISDILEIAKIESGQLSVNLEECNLNELFAELTIFFTEYQNRLAKQKIVFSLQMQAQIDRSQCIIMVDKTKLKQIFTNLISNAFKFTDSGFIEGGCKIDVNNNLIFYVSDSGIGISPDKHEAIFDRFSQLNHISNRLYGGTGLGLSIVKGLLTLLGGKIWLESEPGNGSTFTFTLPYKMVDPFPHVFIHTQSPDEFNFSQKTILLVEDDEFNASYIREVLSFTGINIINAACGIEAINMANSQTPDLVLLDIRLPDMDGYEVMHQLWKKKPTLAIIAQTAYAGSEDKQKVLKEGCVDYISKPLDPDLLLAKISNQLNNLY